MKCVQTKTVASRRAVLLIPCLLAAGVVAMRQARMDAQTQSPRFAGPTSSQPLALNADGTVLMVANPDNNSVTLFDIADDRNARLGETAVGREPNGVALLPDGSRAYVANTVSGTVSVFNVARRGQQRGLRFIGDLKVGTEPYGLALTPNGKKLYVTNARSNSVSIIDTAANLVIKTVENVGFEPRGVAITNDGDGDDDDETVFITQFLALPVAGKIDGEDDSKSGFVTVMNTSYDQVISTVELKPMKDTGFKAAGDAIARTAPPATITEADLKFTTGAYPNQLNNVAIRGNFAFIPSTGASPNGPVRFDVNTQSLLSAIDIYNNADANQTVNMHVAVKNQTSTPKRFITQPWAMAFKNRADEGYVVSAASNIMIKVKINPQTGAPSVESDPSDTTRVLQIPTGRNPRGVAINTADTRAYVMNYVSRDLTVVDLTSTPEKVLATIRSAALPTPGTFDDAIHIGKELYNTSVGEFDSPSPFAPPPVGRMSNNGWGSCASCHPNGLTDNVVWIFAAGPRRTIPQHADFDFNDPESMRVLNWTGIFDEQEDFELNIRGVSGGQGMLVGENGIAQDNPVAAFTPANAGRRQLTVRDVGGWDAIKAYVQFGIRAPLSPVDKNDPEVIEGEWLFKQANCQSCHGGNSWSSSKVKHTAPPAADLLKTGQVIEALRAVGTFDATAKNEVRATAAAPLGADGFVPPSLLSISAFPKTFFHNGSAESLDAVMSNATHRSAGTPGTDTLGDAGQRRKLVKFLQSIDANSQAIPVGPGL